MTTDVEGVTRNSEGYIGKLRTPAAYYTVHKHCSAVVSTEFDFDSLCEALEYFANSQWRCKRGPPVNCPCGRACYGGASCEQSYLIRTDVEGSVGSPQFPRQDQILRQARCASNDACIRTRIARCLCAVCCHSERGSIHKAGKTWEEWVLRSPCDSDDENDDTDSGAEEVRRGHWNEFALGCAA
jgi:hypothetical protein